MCDDGDVLQWQEFWDRFYSSIHVKLIRNVDKLAYLQSCLEGEAKDAVAGLETTNDNYEIALNTLKDTFGRKSIVVDAHYKELYNMQDKNSSIKYRRVINYTFGQNKPYKIISPKAEIKIFISPQIERSITVNIVPFIADSVSCYVFRNHGLNITLADDGSLGEEINLLIGNDYYFSFINSGCPRHGCASMG
ncbi:unnamed protein product [Parnassius apollo]|uniref:(apollo) hypothetical protein n=1 Tax=Parnassius apollo TaxID=110799 RepID=A0A8S3XCH8_PARAO|nr:unnamed protein product [Parnassius apollo]